MNYRGDPMGSIPITRSSPGRHQASCGNSSGGRFLITWMISRGLDRWTAPGRCHGLPRFAPALLHAYANARLSAVALASLKP